MFDPKVTIKTEEFIKLLKENVQHPFMSVKMIVKPTRGWDYELSAFVHNIVGEPIYRQEKYGCKKKNQVPINNIVLFISNAFSNEKKKMNTNDIVAQLEELNEGEENSYISFEIYGTQKEGKHEYINNQIVTASPGIGNVKVKETDEFVSIEIWIDRI